MDQKFVTEHYNTEMTMMAIGPQNLNNNHDNCVDNNKAFDSSGSTFINMSSFENSTKNTYVYDTNMDSDIDVESEDIESDIEKEVDGDDVELNIDDSTSETDEVFNVSSGFPRKIEESSSCFSSYEYHRNNKLGTRALPESSTHPNVQCPTSHNSKEPAQQSNTGTQNHSKFSNSTSRSLSSPQLKDAIKSPNIPNFSESQFQRMNNPVNSMPPSVGYWMHIAKLYGGNFPPIHPSMAAAFGNYVPNSGISNQAELFHRQMLHSQMLYFQAMLPSGHHFSPGVHDTLKGRNDLPSAMTSLPVTSNNDIINRNDSVNKKPAENAVHRPNCTSSRKTVEENKLKNINNKGPDDKKHQKKAFTISNLINTDNNEKEEKSSTANRPSTIMSHQFRSNGHHISPISPTTISPLPSPISPLLPSPAQLPPHFTSPMSSPSRNLMISPTAAVIPGNSMPLGNPMTSPSARVIPGSSMQPGNPMTSPPSVVIPGSSMSPGNPMMSPSAGMIPGNSMPLLYSGVFGYGARRPRDPNKPPPVKKYKCDICGKAFSRSNTLVTHRVRDSIFSIVKAVPEIAMAWGGMCSVCCLNYGSVSCTF